MARIFWLVLTVLVLLPGARGQVQAQTGDWQAVQKLNPGTRISVRAQHRFPCLLEYATADELSCKVPDNRLIRLPYKITIRRGDIREIRLESSQAKDGWIGAGIGAGMGVVLGASTGKRSPIPALGGAMIGGVVGTMVPIFRHGKIVYRQ
jgi:hypothetical protein